MAIKKTVKTTAKKVVEKKPEKQLIQVDLTAVNSLILNGDINGMSPDMKVKYYQSLCASLGLNPMTQPFQIIAFRDGKEKLYATKDCTDQLRKIYEVSITSIVQKFEMDVCITIITAQNGKGRIDGATGAVSVLGLKGDALANAIMKSETKAKRRATLSICGMGFLDESEVETIPDASVKVFSDTQIDPKEKAREEALKKLSELPQIIKENFEILGYQERAQYLFCQKFNWEVLTIKKELGTIIEMKKLSDTKKDEKNG